MQDKSKDLFWISYIRAIAIFGVVVIHVSADVITEWGAIPKGQWWAANFYDSLVRGCVPMFIMISGALLLPVQESLTDFFRKRLNRILIPFAFWTIAYLLWKKVFYRPDLGLLESLHMVSNAGVWFHLWFFYVLIGLYLITPIFRVFIINATRKEIGYLLILWFALVSLDPFADKIAQVLGFHWFSVEPLVIVLQGFIGYFILGAYLVKFAQKEWVRWSGALWLGSLLACIAGTWWLSARSGTFQQAFYDNMAPNVVFYCASFFVLAKFIVSSLEGKIPSLVKNSIINLSKTSFGIYLVHPMIIDILDKGRLGFTLKPNNGQALIMIPLLSIVICFSSFIVVWLIQKIPFLKRVA